MIIQILLIISAIIIVALMIIFIIWLMKERGYFIDNEKGKQESITSNEENYEKIKIHREKAFKYAKIFVLWISISIPIIIITLIYFPIYANLIVYFTVFVPIFLIILMLIYHILEEQALKSQKLSQSGKFLIIILTFILFIVITLKYFGVFQIY